ncbi:33822_t:CDS:2, partial [Gigaspora margarita]
FSLRFISNHRNKIINRIRPVIERRLLYKRKLGDSWDAPCIYIASMSTTSNAAAYALVKLAKRKKDYWQELYQEAHEIDKKSNGKPTYKDFNNLVKMERFIKESFRINSNVLSVPRPCIHETYTFANGFQIPY